MVIKLKIIRHVEKPKTPATRLVIERVTSKTTLAKKQVKKTVVAKKVAVKKIVAVKKAVVPPPAVKKAVVVKRVAVVKSPVKPLPAPEKPVVAEKVEALVPPPKKVPAPKKSKIIEPIVASTEIAEEMQHIKKSLKASKKDAKTTSLPTLPIGSEFPIFSMQSTLGTTITRDELFGTRYVIYFYPKDQTPGCITEAREFSLLVNEFANDDVRIFGVSPDSLESHMRFVEKEGIKFPLLVDENHSLASACGVWGTVYNKRVTFVVGKDGLVERVYHDVRPNGHSLCVLNDLNKL